jgi:hypothetical protein
VWRVSNMLSLIVFPSCPLFFPVDLGGLGWSDWSCADCALCRENYAATANLTLDWKCETVNWTNPDWTWPPQPGSVYYTEHVTCDPLTIVLDNERFAMSVVG